MSELGTGEQGIRRAARASVRPPAKSKHVYAELKEAILSGRLPPGTPIDKASLCDRLGVSRFPVATALQRLAFEQLVVIAPQHGSFVARIALTDVLECMMIRGALEGEVAALVAERRPAGLADAMERNLRYQRAAAEAADVEGFYRLDVDFHHALLVALDLSHATTILDSLRGRLERIRRILSAPAGRTLRSFEAHRAIADAVKAGDPQAARTAMRSHLDETTAQFQRFATSNPTLFSDLSHA